MIWEVANGNAAVDRSASVSVASSSRLRGPMRPSTAYAEDTSNATARASGGMLRQSQLKSRACVAHEVTIDRKSTRLNSSHGYISYAVFCLKKKTAPINQQVQAGRVFVKSVMFTAKIQ